MPKVILAPAQAERERLQHNISLIQGKRTNAAMGKLIGVSGTTFSKRKEDPESLTLAEVRLMCKYFHIDPADFVAKKLEIG